MRLRDRQLALRLRLMNADATDALIAPNIVPGIADGDRIGVGQREIDHQERRIARRASAGARGAHDRHSLPDLAQPRLEGGDRIGVRHQRVLTMTAGWRVSQSWRLTPGLFRLGECD